MSVIQRELRRGLEITDKIMTGKRPWSDLFIKHTFFTQGYKYYISVISTSKNEEAHKVWSGYIESKVRMLVQKLEQHPSINLAHAFNKGYERRHKCTTSEDILRVQEGSMDYITKSEDPKREVPDTVSQDGPEIKKEEPSSGQRQDAPSTKQTENGSIEGGQEPQIKKEEHEPSTTDIATAPSTTMDIYTTTHYIGLELTKGKYIIYSHGPNLDASASIYYSRILSL